MTIVNTFLTDIETEGNNLLVAGENAWNTAKAELETLGEAVLTDVKEAISSVIASAEAGATIEQMETMVLNLLQAEVTTILKSFTSGALQVLIVFAKSAL